MPKLISIVVPCFNEEEVVRETHRRLNEVLRTLAYDYEIVYVDDGSRDRTYELLREIQATDEHTRIVALSRNFGHQVAVSAGLEHARGDAVVLIDADLQDPPEVIPRLVEQWEAGYDVAYGQRTDRAGESWFKLATAKLFYQIIHRVSNISIPMNTGDFRLMDRRVVDSLAKMPERDRFVRGMVSWVGFRQTAVPYKREARFAGTTKYPLSKMLRFSFDAILSFSHAPLQIATWIGVATCMLSALGIVYALILRLFTTISVPGWTLMFIAMLFIGGLQFLYLGLIGEYIGRIYIEGKQRPMYLVRDKRGFPTNPQDAA